MVNVTDAEQSALKKGTKMKANVTLFYIVAVSSVALMFIGVIGVISLCVGERGVGLAVPLLTGALGLGIYSVLCSFDKRLSALEARQDTSAETEA